MDLNGLVGRFANLGLRTPVYNSPHHDVARGEAIGTDGARIVTRDCVTDPNLCEKPVSSETLTIPIVLGIAIPLVVAVAVFIYLHRRSVARQMREDAIDIDKTADFGMSESFGRKKKGLVPHEKSIGHKNHQLSMDMDMSTPYLLPPGLNGSRDSLNTLARSLNNEDPYRPVTSYGPGDNASVRSWKRANGKEGSIRSPSRAGSAMGGGGGAPPRQNSLSKAVATPAKAAQPPRIDTSVDAMPSFPTPSPRENRVVMQPMSAEIEEMPSPSPGKYSVPVLPPMPEIQEPEPAAVKTSRGVPDRPRRDNSTASRGSSTGTGSEPRYPLGDTAKNAVSTPPALPEIVRNEFDFGLPKPDALSSPSSSPRQFEAMPPSISGLSQHPPDSPRTFNDNHPQFPLQGEGDDYDTYDHEPAASHRHSLELHMGPSSRSQPLGLSVPRQGGDNRRLSVGLRPLPPSDIGDSDDPEYRANRIRSFYKEYFEDIMGDSNRLSRAPMPEPPPPPPQQQQQQKPSRPPPRGPPQPRGSPQPRGPLRESPKYYEDYDQGSAGDAAAYYDPDTNAFVMPYSQPVTRRAMTPPPSRFRGHGGPPRNMHGSIGGMPGMSNGPRPGSSVSNRVAPARPGSSMSGRGRNPNPRPRLPLPAALNTLPTPSKLRDDTLVINPLDFAPPDTFTDRTRGRSQSPMGERRPYKLNVAAHSPLVSSYDELAAVPSPHMLRKSNTFTGLDFALPRKFHDADNRSDAGSIRSYKSNLSNVNLQAIRDQTHLPEDTIFGTDASATKLRPQWGMRGD